MSGGLPPLDFLIVTVLVLIIVNGGRRGFLKESAMLISILVGAAAARHLGPMLAKVVWRDGVQPNNAILAYLSVLVIVLIVVATTAAMIRPALSNPTLRMVDLMAGLALGACEGLLLIGTASSLAGRLNLLNSDSSRLGPFFANWTVAIIAYLPPEMRSLDRFIWLGSSLSVT